jgi:hypothetical protein
MNIIKFSKMTPEALWTKGKIKKFNHSGNHNIWFMSPLYVEYPKVIKPTQNPRHLTQERSL